MVDASAASPAVLSDTRQNVLLLTLNRPLKSNALEPALVDALRARLREAATDASIHVVVLTGSGRAFCAGLDLKHLIGLQGPAKTRYLGSVLELFREVWRLPQPVIAAINGAAVAGGFDLSSFCDLRIAASDAVFAQTEVLIGLNAISVPLFHNVGLANARELAYLGEKIPASEALRIGLVNRVVEPDRLAASAFELAATIATRPRASLVATKRLTREMLDQEVDAGLEAAGREILDGLERPAHAERLAPYLERLSKSRTAPRQT